MRVYVSTMEEAEITTGRAIERRRRRGRRGPCVGSYPARTERDRQNMCVALIPYTRQSHAMTAAKTAEIDTLRFTDKDLDVVGTLEYGQYGVVGGLLRGALTLC